jgi:hypothetical protein
VFIVFGEIWKDVFVSGIWPPASQSKKKKKNILPFTPPLFSSYYDARIRWSTYLYTYYDFFIILLFFIFFAFILSSIPLFSSKRKLKPAFTKLGGQEGHPKKLRRGKASDSFFIFYFFLQSFFFCPHFTMNVFGRRA